MSRPKGDTQSLAVFVHVFDNEWVLETLGQLRSLAIECADMPTWPLTDPEIVDCLDTVHQVEQALAAVKLHLVRQADISGIPAATHHASCAGWLRDRLRVSTRTARRLVEMARALDRRPDLDQALSHGAEQAAVIVDTLTALPAEAGPEISAKAEATLIGWACEFDPHGLHRLGTRVLDHVAPELADKADADALARQERRAHDNRTFTLSPVGDGRVRLSGYLDTESAAVVNAALEPLCAPHRSAPTTSAEHPSHAGQADTDTAGSTSADTAGSTSADTDTASTGTGTRTSNAVRDERTPGQRRADALVDVCRLALNTGELPANGGDRPQLNVTIDYDTLRSALGAATLDTGEKLTAAQARRLACDAQILPAVLDGDGRVLDVGQTRRLISGPLRRALVLRDQGCAFPGCDRPPRWCDGHHVRHWVDGGSTSLDNSVLLCGAHHRLIHHSDWDVRLGPDGLPEFLPPPHIDPHRAPRRNIYHQRRCRSIYRRIRATTPDPPPGGGPVRWSAPGSSSTGSQTLSHH